MSKRSIFLSTLGFLISVAAPQARAAQLDGSLELGLFLPNYPGYQGPGYTQGQSTGIGLRLTGEWIPLSGWMGKLTLGIGAGYGKLNETATNPFVEAFPLEASIAYRADFNPGQWVVPYASTGPSLTLLHQQFLPGMQRFKGWEYGGGVALYLGFVDALLGNMKDRYSLAQTSYIAFDFRHVGYLGAPEGPNLSRDEFRLALRMEY